MSFLFRSKILLASKNRLFSSTILRPALTQFSEDESQLQEMVNKFAQQEIQPLVQKMDHDAKLDSGLLSKLFENGLMGIEIPEKYGGSGMSFIQSIIAIEEISRVDPGVGVLVDVQNTLVNTTIKKYGTEEQKEKYLTSLASGSVGSFCLSESGSGSDAFALSCKAEKKGSEYILNGSKLWISNALEANIFVVFANIDFSLKHRGITAFIVERDNPGLEINQKEDKLGIRSSSTCPITLTDCRVSEKDILWSPGKGYKIAIETLNEGRIGISAQMVGLAQGAFDIAMPYIHERKCFGEYIADFQGMQFSYAQAKADIEAARLLTYNAARLRENGYPFISEACMAKIYSSQVAERVASKAIEWCGGVAFAKEFGLEKFYRDAKIGSIYEGTTNIQLQTLAKEIQKQYKS